jgi:hypothetical protein
MFVLLLGPVDTATASAIAPGIPAKSNVGFPRADVVNTRYYASKE